MENFYSITNVNSEPLTFEKEISLLRQWKKRKLASAREHLVKNYLLFTIKKVKQFYSALPEDDAVLLAHRTLLTSINAFDAERENVGRLCNLIPFYAKVEYRKFCRESELVKCPAALAKEGRYVSLDAPVDHSSGGALGNEHDGYDRAPYAEDAAPEVDLNDLLGVDNPEIDREIVAERHAAVREAIAKLEPRQKQVIMFVYFDKLDYAATARKMKPSCSREWIRQLHDKAIASLRDAIKKTEHV